MFPSSDRNLLFGLLALHNDYLTREQLLDGINAWLKRKDEPLGDVLQQGGLIAPEEAVIVEVLVARHLLKHGGDVAKSLAAARSGSLVRSELSRIDDADVRASAASLAPDTVGDTATAPPAGAPSGAMPAGAMRYRKLRFHARGGLGEVSVARDEELGREVALKEIQERGADSPEYRARFAREAEITGNLEHPGIVPVYGLGSGPDGRPYYAMKFIRGESMQQAIERFHKADKGRRDPSERELALRGLLGRFVAVCNAVGYAHSRGVIHRDLKPGNVMLGEYGETLVVDWGLAKVVGQTTEVALPLPVSTSGSGAGTELGHAVGTPAYMPPEQARGEHDKVDHRSDVFALGATLYCLLTGQPPYARGGDITQLLAIDQAEFPPARRVNPRAPQALEAVCARAMAARPEGRYAGAGELAVDVERFLADEPVTAMPEPAREKARRWVKRNRTLVTSGAVLLLAGVVGLGGGLAAVRAEELETRLARDDAERKREQAEANLGRAVKAEAEANANLTQARANLRRAEENDRLARGGLQQAGENFRLARTAVDETFGLAKEHPDLTRPDLGPEVRQARRLLLEKALPFYTELRLRRPGQRDVERDAWDQHSRVAYIQRELGRPREAEENFRQAERVARALVEAHPGVPLYLSDLARSLGDLSYVRLEMGRHKEAAAGYEEAIRLYRNLRAAQPGEREHQHRLGRALNNLGNVQREMGRRDEALASYQEAAGLGRTLVGADSEKARYRQELAHALNNIGLFQRQRGRPLAALASYEEAIRVYRGLVEAYPRLPDYRNDLARTTNNLGNVWMNLDRPDVARARYEVSVRLHRAAAEAEPANPLYRTELARALNGLGGAQRELGLDKEAQASSEEAVRHYRAVVAGQPNVPNYRLELARALLNLGVFQSEADQPEDAQANFAEAVDLTRALLKSYPGNTELLWTLCVSRLYQAQRLRQLDRIGEARRCLDEGATLLAGLKKLIPNHPILVSAQMLADAERARDLSWRGEPQTALIHWDRALALAPPHARGGLRLERALSLARAGDHDRAAAEADDVLRQDKSRVSNAADAARVYARCAAAARRDDRLPLPRRERLAERRAQQALAWLRVASKADHIREAGQRIDLANDPDLAFLRDRPDFRALVASLPTPAK